MSRYRKIITGETELKEISGTKFLIYPTIETRMELLEHQKAAVIIEEIEEEDEKGNKVIRKIKGKHFDIKAITKTCGNMVYEACWEHDENGKRGNKKETEKDTTYDQILLLILNSDIMGLYLEILKELGIISKDAADKLEQGLKDENLQKK